MKFFIFLQSASPSVLFVAVCVLIGTGCASKEPVPAQQNPERPVVDEKYRLTPGTPESEAEKLRSAERQKIEDDEKKVMEQLFADAAKAPAEIQKEFDRLLREKRNRFQRDKAKARQDFVREERLHKQNFMSQATSERKTFLARKPSSEARKAFLDEQEKRRQNYFIAEREARDVFESDNRDDRKNFDDYVRSKTSEFNQEHRAYSKKFRATKSK